MTDNLDQPSGNALTEISEAMGALTTGVPPAVQKTFWKAAGRIFTGMAEVPASYFEGKAAVIKAKYESEAAEIRAKHEARSNIIRHSGDAAASQFADPALTQRALEYHAADIVRGQKNRENIALIAAKALRETTDAENAQPSIDKEVDNEISDDWMNTFLKDASLKSITEVQELYGRILAGEVKSPGAFSLKTLQVVSTLEQRTAKIFQDFCNSSTDFGRVRIIDLGKHASENGLASYGLSYNNLSDLVDAGLVRAEFSEYTTIAKPTAKMFWSCNFAGRDVALVSIEESAEAEEKLQLKGPSLTQAGTELRRVVPMEPNKIYFEDFSKWLKDRNLRLMIMHPNERGSYNGRPFEI
ncbi:hypothetical protein A6A40_26435 (plasmid) [Azospirillum humicireducens]|uniref:DUF2806 domain-containing protein n=1 Tax=Azospirillum humicireducens TaxID=1226968 RepID=A0A2R4VVT6_9PROT|nr:DUF2806 domain-containing protein [Azospirillum humicireducens]AWB08535.1 hypothetical protein A6A40_26435 [Azospirillum humicireducens]